MATIFKETEETRDQAHVLAILDSTGDTKIMWDEGKPDEVEHARRTFDDMKARGYTAYATDKKGNQAELMRTFDPKAERMIMHKQMAGG